MKKTLSMILVLVLLIGLMPMTVFAAEEAETNPYKGKVISILGDSSSTFAGYIPVADGFNLAHRARYPQSNLLTDVNETWWMQVITALGAKLGVNDSWAGSQVLNTLDTNSGDLGPDVAMASLTRIQNLGSNGTPDVILFYGAGNDIGRAVPLGEFNPGTAPQTADLTTAKWDTFADAYVAAILRLKHFYPDSAIVVMLYQYIPSYFTNAELDEYNSLIQSVCDHYNIPTIDLRNSGVTSDMLPDNIHPNAEGMDLITQTVLNALIADCTVTPGENVIYSISHKLVNATASKHYYKAVSAGSEFSETITGETITITMGGVDITADCYSNGTITISEVTGDIVITAKGDFNADGHLQQLPDAVCASTNLWTALEPENIYYTANGWGNVTAGTAWSITFPVQTGDQIWATSFGKSGENGDTANGVRITWFDENGVLATVDRNTVYKEFVANGHITAPEGALALNVTMASNNPNFEVYILSAEHNFVDDICSICGSEHTNPELEGHLQQLPENICSGTNLWTALTPENIYYLGAEWGLYANAPNVHSVTIPVTPGDQLWATSFGPASGDKTGNGTRITWFDENSVLESVSRDVVYNEFLQNGYIIVPEGAIAVNIPMDTGADSWEIYILNWDHTYENGICTGCGAVQPGPVITQQPTNGEAKMGERYMVEVKAEGEGLTYQWYFRNASSNGWYKSSVKDNTYDDVMTTARAGREVYCVITDANGNSVTTDTAKLICLPSEELAIVTQPTNGEAVLGERYCVTVEAKGEKLKYQWYFRNKGAKSWSKSGVTDNTYDDVMTTARAGREVYCVITDAYGNKVTTDTVKLVRVPEKLEIISQPTNTTAAFDEMFCAAVEAKGEGLKYQWYYRNAGSDIWHKSGVRDNTYDDLMTKARANREVYCVITDTYGNTVTTDVVKLIAIPKVELKILSQTYESAAMGERYCVTVNAQGEGLKYQWYFRNAGSNAWYKSSVKDNTYDDVMTKARAGRDVYCVITDAYGNQVVTETVKLMAK